MALQDQLSLQSCHLNLEREKVLFEIISKIRESLDLDVVLQTTIQELRQLLTVDRVGIVRLDAATGWDEGEFVAETVMPRFDSALAVRVRDHCFGKQYATAYQNGRILAVEDIYNAGLSDCHIRILSQFQVRANLLVPLLQGKDLWGLLCIHQCSGPRQWTSDDIDFVSQIAVHLGIAIQHAELLAQTQKQSLELNQALKNLKLVHTQLAQAEKMASLGQLSAGIAHEINNPVNFIHGNLPYVDGYLQDLTKLITLYQTYCPQDIPAIQAAVQAIDVDFILEDLPKVLGSMANGATRIKDIVQGLRDFSRLDEAGLKAVNLHESIDNTLLMLSNRLRIRGNRPAVQLQKNYGQLPPVECCPGQINQVLMSILTNAIDVFDETWAGTSLPSNPPAPPALFISTQATADAVLIMIEDNGPGMTDAVKAKLYDPFFTTKPVGQGTGLGLAISHQIVAQHQGILQCVSELGQGTEFSIKLPIRYPRSAE